MPGCTSAGATTFTPGWCTGGTASNFNDGIGSFYNAHGIDVDAANDWLYVTDNYTQRVSKYVASTGAFIGWSGKIGAVPTGGVAGCTSASVGQATPGWCTGGNSNTTGVTGDGFLNSPSGVAVSATNNALYVFDRYNNRISRFNATTGAFTGWIGRIGTSPTGGDAGCSGAASATFTPGWCTGGTASALNTGNGTMSSPSGGAVSADGTTLYVADTANGRISRYNAVTGAFTGWMGKATGAGLTGPAGCASVTAGQVTPAFCTGGNGTPGFENGAFSNPASAAIDGTTGDVYVADEVNHRIVRIQF
jgi:DNA-binding beta-propeller fold protein YncE